MKKFWNSAENEVFIYGDIASATAEDSDVTAKNFVADLKKFGNKDLTIHINSAGGDVFTGLAIYNVIKNYKGKTTVQIDGLAASAASIIACAGDVVKMAANAIYMVHPPSAGLVGFFESTELAKVQASLETIKESLITTYEMRTGKSRDEIEKLVDAESWLSADEALENNFIDEITGAVEAEYENGKRTIFLNKVEIPCSLDMAKVIDKTHATERKVDHMEEVKNAVAAERARISDLLKMKCENAAINKIVDLAINDGKTVAEIAPYVDAVKGAVVPEEKPQPVENNAFAELSKLIMDQMKSGAEGVTGGTPPVDKNLAQIDQLAGYMNEIFGKAGVQNG